MAAMFGALTTFDANAGTIKYTWTAELTMAGVEDDGYGAFYASMPAATFGINQQTIVDVYGAMFSVDGDYDDYKLGWMLSHPDPERLSNGEVIAIFGESIIINVEITSTIIRKCALSYPKTGGTNGTHELTINQINGREVVGQYALDFVDYHDAFDVSITIGAAEFTGTITPDSDSPIAGIESHAEIGQYNYVDLISTEDDGIYGVSLWNWYERAGIHERTNVADVTWEREIDSADCTCKVAQREADIAISTGQHVWGAVNGNNITLDMESEDYEFDYVQSLHAVDYAGPFTLNDTMSLQNVDAVPRTSTITGAETKPYIDDTIPHNPIWYWREDGELRPFSGYPLSFGGAVAVNILGLYHELCADIPEPQDKNPIPNAPWPCLQHGDRRINNIAPTFEDGDWVEGSMHEPMPWSEPNPLASDFTSLIYHNEPRFRRDDALVLALTAPGATVGTPFTFADNWSSYVATNCSRTLDAGMLKCISVARTDGYVSRSGITNTRLTGARYARIYWSAPVGAKARVSLQGKAWTLTSVGNNFSVVDLCSPEDVTGADDTQSIAPVENPFAVSAVWNLSKYWGVGRLTDVEIELLTENTDYYFGNIELFRKAAGEGGFAKLLVSHANGPWNDNDNDALIDFSRREAGGEMKMIPKAYLIIDGAVVWELMQGHHEPEHFPVYYKLTRPVAQGGIGLPLNNYASPSAYGTAGLTVGIANFSNPDTNLVDAFCLVSLLDGGEYLPGVDNKIRVPLTLRPKYWRVWGACNFRPLGSYHRFRSPMFGLIFNPDGSPYTGSLQARTERDNHTVNCNTLGFYLTPALYNRYPGKIAGAGTGHLVYNPTGGHLLYDPDSGHLVYDSGKSESVEMRSRLQSRLSFRLAD